MIRVKAERTRKLLLVSLNSSHEVFHPSSLRAWDNLDSLQLHTQTLCDYLYWTSDPFWGLDIFGQMESNKDKIRLYFFMPELQKSLFWLMKLWPARGFLCASGFFRMPKSLAKSSACCQCAAHYCSRIHHWTTMFFIRIEIACISWVPHGIEF